MGWPRWVGLATIGQIGHKGTNSPRLYLVDWQRWIGLATIERAGHDGIEPHGHGRVGWSPWGVLATIGWGDLATKGRLAMMWRVGHDWAGWLQSDCASWP